MILQQMILNKRVYLEKYAQQTNKICYRLQLRTKTERKGPLFQVDVVRRRNVAGSRVMTQFPKLNCHTSYSNVFAIYIHISFLPINAFILTPVVTNFTMGYLATVFFRVIPN